MEGRGYPWEGEPGSAERRNIQKQPGGSAFSRTLCAWDETAEGDGHRSHLANCAEEEQLASAGAFDDEPRGGSEDGVHDHVDAAHD